MNETTNFEPNDDRDRGILTKDDRKFLRGEKEFSSEQSARDARYRIRERVKNGILDFSILLHHLSENDRKHIFTTNFPNESSISEEEPSRDEFENILNRFRFRESISNAVAFLYLGALDVDWRVEDLLESGVKSAEEDRGYVIEDVQITIEVSRSEPDLSELLNKFEKGDSLTAEEIRTLVRSGDAEIDSEMLDKLFERVAEDVSETMDDGNVRINHDEE